MCMTCTDVHSEPTKHTKTILKGRKGGGEERRTPQGGVDSLFGALCVGERMAFLGQHMHTI